MAYKHGVSYSEIATSLLATVGSDAGIPMIFGTAPVGMAENPSVNKPVLCYTYNEAVKAFGYVPAKLNEKTGIKEFQYSISEFIDCAFSKFGVAPVIIVNVLDPSKHVADAKTTAVTLSADTHSVTIEETGIVLSSITLTQTVGNSTKKYALGSSFEAAYDDDGYLVITSLSDSSGYIVPSDIELNFSAKVTDPSLVTADDIVGGVSTSGTKSGLELVEDVFPLYRILPGTLIAPGFSGNSSVAAVMAAKCAGINGVFKCVCAVDISTEDAPKYSDVPLWKTAHNIVDPAQIACWPMVKLDNVAYHLSTQVACLLSSVDANNNDVPYVSPSNQNLKMDGLTLADGTEVVFGQDSAAYLNGNGIVTALNFIGGWKCWGNRTACYDANTDVKDAFIPCRRMFCWVGNTIVQTCWQKVDAPLNRRQIDTVLDTFNIWFNGLTARQYILGGKVEFLSDDNTTADLMDGIANFHVSFTPPSPNRVINFELEYDVSNLESLFS